MDIKEMLHRKDFLSVNEISNNYQRSNGILLNINDYYYANHQRYAANDHFTMVVARILQPCLRIQEKTLCNKQVPKPNSVS